MRGIWMLLDDLDKRQCQQPAEDSRRPRRTFVRQLEDVNSEFRAVPVEE
jgi:hypothetical protein